LDPSDRDRFERLMLPHLDAAYALAFWCTRNEDEARDAVQEAYLRALRFFASFHGGDGRGWLLKIVRNACHELRSRERHAGVSGELDEEALGAEAVAAGAVIAFPRSPEAAAIERAGAEAVRRELRALPPEYREVLVLRELHGLSYREIAGVAAIPIGTVMSRLARGRKLLAARLAGSRTYEETGT
jgi:RNA polymerase sigma-70 factor (ECF subfamily)